MKHEIDCQVLSTHRILTYVRVAWYLALMFDEMNDEFE